MVLFAQSVSAGTGGQIEVQLYADGLLGQEPDLLEQVKAGTLEMTKASASVLQDIAPGLTVFDMPFLFSRREHWRAVVAGPLGRSLLDDGVRDGSMRGLTFFDAGARSFYGRRPITVPEDLAGLVIRIQPSRTMARMVELLGATPRALPWGVVYTALQTGLVDGAENNVTALTFGRHAEVVRCYSYTEHTMVPDVLLMGAQAWASLEPAHRDVVMNAASQAYQRQIELWEESEAASRIQAERAGVAFNHPDKQPFVEKTAPLRAEMAADGRLAGFVRAIEILRGG
jgi:tripartite ATP-independent transporter DctP family solute receptor